MSRLLQYQIEEGLSRRRRDPKFWTWKALARLFNVDAETVRRALEPGYGEKRAVQLKRARDRRGGKEVRPSYSNVVRAQFGRVSEEEFRRAARLIPKDTRDLTGVLMGDPLPGRRALDQRSAP